MLTWSSWLAEVGRLSTLAGCASDLFSLASDAAVTCAILVAGQRADFAVWDLEHPCELAYRFGGGNPCRRVVAAGTQRKS